MVCRHSIEHFRVSNPGQNGIEQLKSVTFWLSQPHQLHYSIPHHPAQPNSVVFVYLIQTDA